MNGGGGLVVAVRWQVGPPVVPRSDLGVLAEFEQVVAGADEAPFAVGGLESSHVEAAVVKVPHFGGHLV